MKKTIILASVAIATLFAFSSCQKEDLDNTSKSGVRIITATLENNATKSTLDGTTPKWAVGDRICLLDDDDSQEITVITGTGDPDAGQAIINSETGALTIATSLDGETLYAVYPASATTMDACSDGNITFTIPAIQDGTFASANICVAKSTGADDSPQLIFSNATAVLKFQTGTGVVGVDVTAEHFIAGKVTASFDGTAVTLATDALDKKYVSAVGTSAPSDNIFYLAVAPVTTGAANVNCYKTDLKGTMAKTTIDLVKNTIYTLEDLASITIDNSDLTGQHGILNGHEYVVVKCGDVNLKWGTMNVGATAPFGLSSIGNWFSWGEVSPKTNYGSGLYTGPASQLNGDISPDSGFDAARENWGDTWRMPTKADFENLIASTNYICQDNGLYFTKYGEQLDNDKSNALFFLPCGGNTGGAIPSTFSSYAIYYTSTIDGSNSQKAYRFVGAAGDVRVVDTEQRYYGNTIRPVSN